MAKVCLINNLYGGNSVGGAEKVVQVRALEYKKKGDSVIIITTKASKNPKIEKSDEGGIAVYKVWIPNIFYYKDLSKHGFILKLIWHFVDIFNFRGAQIINKILKQEKTDVVETHNLMGVGYNFLKKEKCMKGQVATCPYKQIHYLHDVQLVEPSGVLSWDHKKDNVWQKIYSGIMKRKFRGVDEVVSPSEFLRDFYLKRGFFKKSEWNIAVGNRYACSSIATPDACSCSVARLSVDGIDLPFDGNRRACSVHEPLHVSNQKYLFVGSLVEHKGVHILMQAWNMMCAVGNGHAQSVPYLHIVGDGILREEVESWAFAKDNVKVHGRLEGKELEEIYKKCDTLIFPSICIENNPTVIHEAHQYGLKVIASDTGGVSEIVCEDGILVEPGSVEKLIKILSN